MDITKLSGSYKASATFGGHKKSHNPCGEWLSGRLSC